MPGKKRRASKPSSRITAPGALTPLGLDTDRIRTTIITALFSIDVLRSRLVLKGGNALRLVYKIQDRTSLDLDFSLDGEFQDLERARKLLLSNLRERLDSAGFYMFDESFEPKPPHPAGTWGGYLLQFKVAPAEDARTLAGSSPGELRKRAVRLDARQARKWKIEISKHEHCEGKELRQLDDTDIWVYSPAMIVIEKLRAICQQMPAYAKRSHPAPRARDFFDIYQVVNRLTSVKSLKAPENCLLARAVFKAKDVPLHLLTEIADTRAFHALDWASVTQSSRRVSHPFDYYFDFVVQLVGELQALWIENHPSI
jgi:predicted nucleotidyltransferase component of viral defense system